MDFLFAQLSSEVDLNKLEGRARLIELATPLLQKMPDAPARHLLSARLQDLDTRSMERVKVVMRDAGTSQRRTFGGANRFHQTPLRTIIGLLVQEPQLAMSVSDTQLMQLAQLELAGIDLCLALLEFIQADPRIHTGNILENWRDTEHYAALVKMASWQHGLPEHGITQEFQGAVERLLILQTEQRLDVLMTKAGLGQLTAEEKAEWKQLLASRHVH